MKQDSNTSSVGTEAPIIRLRHNRFDGFDVYTVLLEGKKSLFHKEAIRKPLIIGGVFKLLGMNGNLWLCENIDTKMIHIGPDQSFSNADLPDQGKKPVTSSASLQEKGQSA